MLIYVAHPYRGNRWLRVRAEEFIKELVKKYPEHTFISPIHSFGFMYDWVDTYDQGMNMCLELLSKCDCLILCEDWGNSKGCNIEKAFAEEKGIPVYSYIEAVKNGNFKSED